jgi:hypothetical protein
MCVGVACPPPDECQAGVECRPYSGACDATEYKPENTPCSSGLCKPSPTGAGLACTSALVKASAFLWRVGGWLWGFGFCFVRV